MYAFHCQDSSLKSLNARSSFIPANTMNFSELSKYLKAKHALADTWEVYAFEHLPIESTNPTHVQISGGSPTGKKGGFSTWENCLDKKDFILSFEEIAQAKAAL